MAREADAEDGRSHRVVLTRSGRSAARALAVREEEFARQVLERVPAARRAAVVGSLGELLAAVRAATEECCPGAFDHLMAELEGAGEEVDEGASADRCGEPCGCGPAGRRGAGK